MSNDIQPTPKTIVLELTEPQAYAVSNALNNYTHLMIGNYDVLNEICHKPTAALVSYDDMKSIERLLKDTFDRDLVATNGYNSNYGIHNPKVNNRARVLYDIHQSMRYAMSWTNCLLGGHTVDFYEPHKTDQINPLPNVYIKDDPLNPIYLSFFRRLNHSINQMITKRDWKCNSVEHNTWIQQCKDFAIYENNHIVNTNTALPSEEYFKFFNEKLDESGKYIVWNDDE